MCFVSYFVRSLFMQFVRYVCMGFFSQFSFVRQLVISWLCIYVFMYCVIYFFVSSALSVVIVCRPFDSSFFLYVHVFRSLCMYVFMSLCIYVATSLFIEASGAFVRYFFPSLVLNVCGSSVFRSLGLSFVRYFFIYLFIGAFIYVVMYLRISLCLDLGVSLFSYLVISIVRSSFRSFVIYTCPFSLLMSLVRAFFLYLFRSFVLSFFSYFFLPVVLSLLVSFFRAGVPSLCMSLVMYIFRQFGSYVFRLHVVRE